MSYRQIFCQVVFGTKNREATIAEEYCEELYKYIWGIIKNNSCKLYQINGTEDQSMASFRSLQTGKTNMAAFTYSIKGKGMIINYVKTERIS